jgi:hypothetical protein
VGSGRKRPAVNEAFAIARVWDAMIAGSSRLAGLNLEVFQSSASSSFGAG